jgi:hypothetical protein
LKVLCAWELGGGLGHALPLLRIGSYLRNRDIEVVHAFADVAAVPMNFDRSLRVVQAPLCKRKLQADAIVAETFADVLMQAGYADIDVLGSQLKAWKDLLELLDVKILITDFAPTAAIAGKCLGLPVLGVGTGFCNPPCTWPPFDLASPLSGMAISRIEHVKATIAGASEVVFGGRTPAPERLLTPTRLLLTCWRELDHYAQREPDEVTSYIGPISAPATTIGEAEGASHAKQILLYVKAEAPDIDKLVVAANQLNDAQVTVYCPDAATRSRWQRDLQNLRIVREPINLSRALRDRPLVMLAMAQCAKRSATAALLARFRLFVSNS